MKAQKSPSPIEGKTTEAVAIYLFHSICPVFLCRRMRWDFRDNTDTISFFLPWMIKVHQKDYRQMPFWIVSLKSTSPKDDKDWPLPLFKSQISLQLCRFYVLWLFLIYRGLLFFLLLWSTFAWPLRSAQTPHIRANPFHVFLLLSFSPSVP